MFDSFLESSSIPVLEQVVNFTQARHTVLAGNIANLDTPGYRVRDLEVEDFQARLKKAIESRRAPRLSSPPGAMISPGHMTHPNRSSSHDSQLAEISKNPRSILYHDDSNVGIEHQVTEMVKNQGQHNLALSIMTNQFRLLHVAISERL